MSNFCFLAKSSIGLTGQQFRGLQDGYSGSSSWPLRSSSGASSSNAQQASVKLTNETNGNAPAAVAKAVAIVELNRSILTQKPYYPNKDGDFKTWSNMTMQSEKTQENRMTTKWFSIQKGDVQKTRILAVQGCIVGKEIKDNCGYWVSRIFCELAFLWNDY